MDFKSLLSKLDSMEAPASTPAAPTLDKAVQLNEDAQLRVLAGQTTYVAEAKKKKDEEKKEEKKVDEAAEKTATTWTDSKGNKHPATKVKGDKYTGKEAEKEDKADKKSKKDESVEVEFKSKFMKMVEAKKEEADKKKADAKKKKMDEGSKPDFLDIDKDGDKEEPMKKAAGEKGGDKKDSGKKGMSDKQAKYFGKKNESVKTSKKVVAESAGNVLSFRDMIKLVQESGGQQAIDPIDTTLFAWAQRVAASKYTESAKAEVFAGMLYERNGGRFEMYDVLSESKKKLSEGRVQLDEGMIDKVKSLLMSKLMPKLSDQEKSKMASVAQKVLGKDKADPSDFTLANFKEIAKALGAKPEPTGESIEEGPVGDFFGQKKKDPKSGRGTLGGIDAWAPSATLGEKLTSLTGILGGAAATIAGIFGGPAWLIIPGFLAIMVLSQVGMDRDGSS
jgi:hypothetical protein